MSEDRIKLAEKLEAQAKRLRQEAVRKLPDFWRVGQKVRYLRDSEWAWGEGDIGFVSSLRDEYKNKPAQEYQVFYTTSESGYGSFWTTPDDVELLEDVK